MVEHTFDENSKMFIMYGEAGRNDRAAQCMYHEHFPHCSLHVAQLSEYNNGCEKQILSLSYPYPPVDFEEEVLYHVAVNPSMISRNIAHDMNVPHMNVWRTLHDHQLHSYHPQQFLAMGPADV